MKGSGQATEAASPLAGRSDERRVAQLLNQLVAFVAVLDRDGRVKEVDDAALELGGVTLQDVRGRPFWETVWWSHDAAIREEIEASCTRAAQGKAVRFRTEARLAGDGRMPVLCHIGPILGDRGEVEEIVVSGVDISEEERIRAEAQQVEDAAAAQLSELEALYDALPVGVAVHDRDLRFLRMNRKLAELNGLPLDAHLGKRKEELLPGVDPAVRGIIERVFETGEPALGIGVRAELPSAPGEIRDFVNDYYPIKLGGETVAVGTCVREVTRERALEADVLRRESQLRRLIDGIPATATIHEGPDHIYRYSNRVSNEAFGGQDVVGRSLRDVMEGPGSSRIAEVFDEVYRTGEPAVFPEMRLDSPREGWFYIAILPWFAPDGSVGGTIGFSYDITSVVESRRAVDRHATVLRLALLSSGAGVWQVDVRSGTVVIDAGIQDMFNLDGDGSDMDIAMDRFDSVVHPEDLPALKEARRTAAERGRFEAEFRVIGKDGATRWLMSVGEIHSDSTGQPYGGVGLLIDITERQAQEERLKLLNRELNHRVKNLFAIVRGIVSVSAQHETDLGPAIEKILGRIEALASAHLLSMEEVPLTPIALGEVIGAVLAPHVPEGDPLTLSGPDVAVARSTLSPLSMILHELATNAIKHGPWSSPDGEIRVEWNVDEEDGGRNLVLEWIERGRSAPQARESSSGFGTELLRGCTQQLKGKLVQRDHKRGRNTTLIFPLR